LTALTNASTTLRSEASALGSNLSIVQIRQDFSKNLINVLQTGASNLTLADTNEEAANSRRCRPASRSRSRRWRWPTSRRRACCNCCADLDGSKRYRSGGGNPAVFSFEASGRVKSPQGVAACAR